LTGLPTTRGSSGESAYVWTVGTLFLIAMGLALFDAYQFISLVA
jgi:hypothetical protein